VVLSAWPGLLKYIPKPGAWMETLKQVMGFLLMATVVWLIWVLALQTGATTIAMILLGLVLLGIGGWMWGKWGTPVSARRTRLFASVFTVIFILSGFGLGLYGISFGSPMQSISNHSGGEESLQWESFSQEKLDRLIGSGDPVFVDFTAAWCLSCQVNERVALEASEVVDRFNELGVKTLKADWTSYNEEITRALAEHGRNSVPLYVLYTDENDDSPIILPEILTPGLVLETLEKIDD